MIFDLYARDQSSLTKMIRVVTLNHLLPALAGVKPNLVVKVEHREDSR